MQPGVTNPLNEPPVTSSQKWPARRHRERKSVHRRLLACNARRKSIAPAQLARIHFIDSSACNGICVFSQLRSDAVQDETVYAHF